MDKIKNFFTSKLGKVLLVVLAVLALFAGGYGAGRLTTPAKVVEKEKIVTQTVEKVVYQDKIVYQKVYIQVEKKHESTETTTTKKPDGTETTTTKTNTDTDTTAKTDEHKTEDKVVYKDRVVVQIVEKLKVTEAQKLSWRVGVDGGISIPHYLGQADVGVPGLQGFVIGAHVDRRIVGPFWMGLYGNTQGTAGLRLDLEF